MVTSTFTRLGPAKQARIISALIAEFSRVPLADAQVSNIVAAAEIARGAFYTYFDSLDDAYAFVLSQALVAIHVDLPRSIPKAQEEVHHYIARTREFLEGASNSDFYELIRMHFRANEERHRPKTPDPDQDPFTWQVTTLVHETIREAFIDPDHQAAYLHRLETALLGLVTT